MGATVRYRPLLWVSCLLLGVTLACGLQSESAPNTTSAAPRPLTRSGPPATPPPLAGTPASLEVATASTTNGFAPYAVGDVDTSVIDSGAPPDLAQIASVKSLERLSKAQIDALAQNGFIVVPVPYAEPLSVYRWAAAEGLPTFLTTDTVIYNVSLLTNAVWRRAAGKLTPDLQILSEGLVRASHAQWLALAEEDEGEPHALADAAWRNLAFFSVGGRLLDPDLDVPGTVADVVAEELTLIEQGGVYISPLFGVQQDYDIYQPDPSDVSPVGYQQAIAWYRHPFSFDDQDPASVRRDARQVLLMALALQESEDWTRWERVYYPTTYFEGTTGSYDVVDAIVALEAVYGEGASQDTLRGQGRLDDFIATLRALPRPPALDPDPPANFRFLSWPQQPDEAMFRELVFNRVGGYQGDREDVPFTAVHTTVGPVRGLPRALDVAAALGSDQALSRLQAAGDADYDGYVFQMEAVRSHLRQLDERAWTQTLGGSWLYAVQPLLSHPPSTSPFVEEDIWWNKQFNTWYGAWLLLRDPFRAAPNSPAAGPQVGTEAAAYIEPEPMVYARLAGLVRQIREGLQGRALVDEILVDKLQRMERLLLALQLIAEKELADEPLTADEALLARQAAERLAALATLSLEGASGPTSDRYLPRVNSIYADAPGGQVVQAALGEAWPIFVLVPGVEQPLLAVGALFSTYELRQPADELLVGSTWREMEDRPATAPWLNEILTP